MGRERPSSTRYNKFRNNILNTLVVFNFSNWMRNKGESNVVDVNGSKQHFDKCTV